MKCSTCLHAQADEISSHVTRQLEITSFQANMKRVEHSVPVDPR